MRNLSLAVLLMAPVSAAFAQERATELGLGVTVLRLSFTGGENIFQFEAGQQVLTLGLYTSPTIAVEPRAAISLTSGAGATLAILSLGVGVPIHTRPTWGREGLFFTPRGGVTVISADASGVGETATQFNLGIDVGTKIPIVDAVSLSTAGGITYGFENDTFDDVFALNARLGVSVFFQ